MFNEAAFFLRRQLFTKGGIISMKYIVVLGDGMADWPLDEIGGRTPLEAAEKPNMDKLIKSGIAGTVHTIPEGMPAGSDVANLSVFGFDP